MTDKKKTIDDYIASQPKEIQGSLRELHSLIREVLPQAAEAIKWGAPSYIDGTILVAFEAYRDHVNLYATESTMQALASDFTGYKTGKISIQLPYDRPLPAKLVKKIVSHRLAEYKKHGVKWM